MLHNPLTSKSVWPRLSTVRPSTFRWLVFLYFFPLLFPLAARVWDLGNKGSDPILTFAKSKHNFKPKPDEPPNGKTARAEVAVQVRRLHL